MGLFWKENPHFVIEEKKTKNYSSSHLQISKCIHVLISYMFSQSVSYLQHYKIKDLPLKKGCVMNAAEYFHHYFYRMDGWTDGRADRQMDRRMKISFMLQKFQFPAGLRMGGWMNGQDGWMDRWIGRQTDGQMDENLIYVTKISASSRSKDGWMDVSAISG